MGYFRLYLALCVVSSHFTNLFPWPSHDGTQAVQIFFIISGFYMQYIQGKYPSAGSFYTSRFLRIFIPYWLVLGFVFCGSLLCWLLFDNLAELRAYSGALEKNGLLGVVLSAASNLTLFGIDSIYFLEHPADGGLSLTANGNASTAPLHKYLLIPQAWTIGLELMFYLLVPFFTKLRMKSLLVLMLLSLCGRLWTYQLITDTETGFGNRFFPFELLLFLLGMVCARLYMHGHYALALKFILTFMERLGSYAARVIALASIIALCAWTTKQAASAWETHIVYLISYLGWALIIPIFFDIFKASKLDRFIGELSYPIYLVHHFVIFLVAKTLLVTNLTIPPILQGLVNGVCSIIISIVLVRGLIIPLDSFRYRVSNRLRKNLPDGVETTEIA